MRLVAARMCGTLLKNVSAAFSAGWTSTINGFAMSITLVAATQPAC